MTASTSPGHACSAKSVEAPSGPGPVPKARPATRAQALHEAILEIAYDPRGHNQWWIPKGFTPADAPGFNARAAVPQQQVLAGGLAIVEDDTLLGQVNAKA